LRLDEPPPHSKQHLFDSLGTYNISEAEGVERGTKITLHLKGDCYDFAKEDIIKGLYHFFLNTETF